MKPLIIPDLDTQPVLSRAQKAAIALSERVEAETHQVVSSQAHQEQFAEHEARRSDGRAFFPQRPLAPMLH